MNQHKERLRCKPLLLLFLSLLVRFSLQAQHELVKVSGTVTDSEGATLPGVSIFEKGTSTGTITNVDGFYSISVKSDATLVYSFIGMTTHEQQVAGNSTIDVSLNPDRVGLDDVVVVGYGSQKKVNLTGAVSSVASEEMAARPVTNISAGLSGMAAGVQVTQNSGATAGNDAATIRIRGVGTMNNSNPLVVVDGVPSESTSIMNDIDPTDIESISVLKDAASASIYGSRGANGVILITTKRGKSGKPQVTYNAYYGIQEIPRLVDYVSDFADYMEIANRIRPNSKIFTEEEIQEWRDNPNDPLYHPNVNWNEEIYGGTAPIMNHSLGYSGGTEKTKYRLSLNYLDQDGIISGNSLKRYGMRTNLVSEVAKGIKLGGNIFFRWSTHQPNNVDYSISWVPCVTKERHPDGRWGGAQSGSISSNEVPPMADLANKIIEKNDRRLMGDVFAEWEITSNLKAIAKVALNYNQGISNAFYKQYDVWNFRTDKIVKQVELETGGRSISSQNQNYQINSNLLLEYKKSFKDHSLKLMAGYESLEYRADNLSAERRQFPNNEVGGINAGLELYAGNGDVAEWTMASYFGRINYNFKDKYLFEANLRDDGSSRFNKDNRWGYFPSFSAGWNLTEEGFLDSYENLDLFKLRASWGQLGNNRIDNYAYHSTYALNQNYSFNGEVYSGIAQTSLSNEDIHWEETTTTNIGVDATLYGGKVSLTAEYFIRQTDGILTELPIPEFLGAKEAPIVNLASMQNIGFEFSAGYRGSINDFNYNISANITRIENKVTDYFADIQTGGTQIGYAFDSFFGYEVEGIFETQEQLDNAAVHRSNTTLGDLQIKDQLTEDTDGDGIPDSGNGVIGSEDRKINGNKMPKYTFGSSIGCNYKGFDFSMLIQGIKGRDRNTFDYAILPMNWIDKGVIPQRWVDEEWSIDNPNGTLPRMAEEGRELNTATSDLWVKDVSYVRIKNLQVGYDLTKSLLKDANLSRFRLYASADNLLTFTNEEWGFDPETTNVRSFNVRTITLGVNVGF